MFESEQAAAEALANANTGIEPSTPSEQAPVAATESQVVEQGATHEDSFTNIDLNTLPPELQALAKNLQGDYTRKTQEIAPLRKAVQEFGVDPNTAREALAFVQALNDPANQQALYERLAEQYGSGDTSEYDEFDDGEINDPRDGMLRDLQGRLEAMEQHNLRAQVSQEISRQESIIRTQNPAWAAEDMDTVARMAVARGGDMLAAAEDYKQLQQRIIGAHLQGKAQVPAGAMTGPGVSGHAEMPTKFESLDDAHAAALKALAADFAS